MLTYLLVGLIVQIVITLTRMARGVCPELDFDEFKDWIIFIGTLIVMCTVNVLIWPLTICFEIINIKNGV